ncbi:MAG: SIR2 family protein [Methanoregula sp.]
MIPPELYDEIKRENCIIFAGAGISTERKSNSGEPTFYEIIKNECEFSSELNPPFPEVMQHYCNIKDGGKKNLLIRQIIGRLESFLDGSEKEHTTTFTHLEIARNPFFRIIVTTNWDTFFERRLNVLVPMVEDRDIPFWDDKKRQILKIHGCVTRPYTMIITQNDYEDLISSKMHSPVFTKLKDLMATKTFLFIGYSMRDPNIKMLFSDLSKSLGDFSRLSYAVDIDPSEETIAEWKKNGVQIIKANAIAFSRDLNDMLVSEKLIPDPDVVDCYHCQLNGISQIHFKDCENQGEKFLTTMYQDGVLHELDYILFNSKYGVKISDLKDRLKRLRRDLARIERFYKNSEKNEKKSQDAEIIEKEQTRQMNIVVDIAYLDGRIEVLSRFLRGTTEPIPSEW